MTSKKFLPPSFAKGGIAPKKTGCGGFLGTSLEDTSSLGLGMGESGNPSLNPDPTAQVFAVNQKSKPPSLDKGGFSQGFPFDWRDPLSL